MSKGFFDTLKADSIEAGYRVAGVQVIKATKRGLLKVLRRKGLNNKHVEKVSNLLDTEIGTAGLSTVIGVMLSCLPSFKNDKRAQGIAKEFKVSGMALAGNLLAAKAVQDLLPKINSLADILPVPKIPFVLTQKIRVAEPTTIAPVYEELEEETVSNTKSSSTWY